jgi:hypothetical protein
MSARYFAIGYAGLLLAAAAHAQTPAPEPKPAAQATESKAAEAKGAEQSPKPRPPLKLKLDDATSAAPRITFTPRDADKKDPAASLPGLGGKPSQAWERPPSAIVPKDMNPGM